MPTMHNHTPISCENDYGDQSHAFPSTECSYHCLEGFEPNVISGTSLQQRCEPDLTWSQGLADCIPTPPTIYCSSIQAYAGASASWSLPEAHDYNQDPISVYCDESSENGCPDEGGTVFEMSCNNTVVCHFHVTYTATTGVGGQASCDVIISVSEPSKQTVLLV